MLYRIYFNDYGWKLLNIKRNIEETIETLDGIVEKDVHEFIVIERDNEKNTEIPIIIKEEDYFRIKRELENEIQYKNKTKSKR